MAQNKTTAHSHAVLNTMRGTAMPAWTPYLALLDAVTDESTYTEKTGANGLTRQAVTMTAPSAKASESTAQLDFGTPSADGQATHVGVFDAATAGTMRYLIPLAATKTWQAGDPVQVNAGEFDLAEL